LQAAADLKLRPRLSVHAWDVLRRGIFGLEEATARLVFPLLEGASPTEVAALAAIEPVDEARATALDAYLRSHGHQVAWLRELRQRRGATVLAAWWQGRVVAHVVLVPRAELPDGRAAVQLVNFHVAAALRGLGLGRRLLEVFRERARAAGASVIRLTVNRGDERAVLFYRGAGFEVVDAAQVRQVPGRETMEGPA